MDGRDGSGSGILLTESSDISRRIRSNLLCIARDCCGLKRVPVRGCRRKCPGTATWRFFMAKQSPLISRPTPPRPRNSPTPNSGAEWLGSPTHRAMTPPAVISSMPRQSSMPWGSGISRGSPCFLGTDFFQLQASSSSQSDRKSLFSRCVD